jgi:hypothetical protein
MKLTQDDFVVETATNNFNRLIVESEREKYTYLLINRLPLRRISQEKFGTSCLEFASGKLRTSKASSGLSTTQTDTDKHLDLQDGPSAPRAGLELVTSSDTHMTRQTFLGLSLSIRKCVSA